MKISFLQFSVENFKIFKERAVFSMFAHKSIHTFKENEENILKTSLLYGPNASGKSSLFEALSFLLFEARSSFNRPGKLVDRYQPFLLGNGKKTPSFFELIFSLNDKIFKYNFSFLEDIIITENLFEVVNTKEKPHFKRNKNSIKLFFEFKKSEDVFNEKTKSDVLFLTAASQWKNDLADQIITGFANINIIKAQDNDSYRGYTIHLFKKDEEKEKKSKILKLLKKADFLIEDGFVETINLPKEVKERIPSTLTSQLPEKIDTISFLHSKFDLTGNKIGTAKINLGDESTGTQKFFDVLGPIVDTLENGKVLLIDEFDNSLHSYLSKFIIDLFENDNPKNAQLIVTTHDIDLLSSDLANRKKLNKEQVWFTERDESGSAKLFSLADFKTMRNDTEFSKKYREGRFGAVPFIKF